MSGGVDDFRFAAVLRAHDGQRVAVDAGYRTYTGTLRYHGETIGVEQEDGCSAWLRAEAITGIRIFTTARIP